MSTTLNITSPRSTSPIIIYEEKIKSDDAEDVKVDFLTSPDATDVVTNSNGNTKLVKIHLKNSNTIAQPEQGIKCEQALPVDDDVCARMEAEMMQVEEALFHVDHTRTDIDDICDSFSVDDGDDLSSDEDEYDSDESSDTKTPKKKKKPTISLKDISCLECGEILRSKAGLSLHMLAKHKPGGGGGRGGSGKRVNLFKALKASLICPVCDIKFESKMDLKKHMDESHEGVNVAKCDACERYFKTADLLERHKRIHTEERPFKCNQCGKGFPWPEHLKAHHRVHFPVKEYECLECHTVFTSSSALKKHERMHKQTFRYICEHCGEGFHVSEPYKIHIRKHVGVKPFECGQCQKQFFSRAACRRHTLTHVELRPWKCGICGKAFREKQTMERHAQVHSGRKPFLCPHCGLGLATKHNMFQHVKKIHPDRQQM